MTPPSARGFVPLNLVSSSKNESSNHTAEWLHSTGRNHWQGWQCSAGLHSIYIDFDGNVFVATCAAGGWQGNVFRQGLDPQNQLNRWIECPAKVCACGSDMYIPKVRSKNLVPHHISELFNRFSESGNIKTVDLVADPDVVVSEANREIKTIIWDIGRRCNYDCSYCYPDAHNSYEAHKTIGSLRHAIDGLHEWWLCEWPGHFVVTGGEPTLNPAYLDFVKYIRQKRVGNTVHTTTNGSRDSRFYSELMLHSGIDFSGHMDSLQNPRTYARFVENVAACVQVKLDMGVDDVLKVRLMLKPGTLELVRRLVADIHAIPDFDQVAILACDLVHEGAEKFLRTYTNEELDFVANPIAAIKARSRTTVDQTCDGATPQS